MENEYARDLANELHASGLSDSKLAELTGVTRGYINRIRNGKDGASESLEAKLQEIYDSEIQHSQLDKPSPPPEEEKEEIYSEESGLFGFSRGTVLTGITAIVVMNIAALTMYNFLYKKRNSVQVGTPSSEMGV